MAQFDGVSKAKAESILGMSVVSAVINPSGHLILTRNNGQTIDAGDFTAIVAASFDAQIDAALLTAVPAAVTGWFVTKNAVSGAISMAEFNSANIVNAYIRVNLVGNATFTAASLPAACKPGTRFYVMFVQDNPNGAVLGGPDITHPDGGWTGGRVVTFTGFRETPGNWQQPGGYDVDEFFFDGIYWHVTKAFANQAP